MPIAPPVFCSQSCGAAPKVGANSARPEVTASSATMQFSGSSAASVLAKASGSNFPRTSCGFVPPSGIGTLFGAPSSSASHSSAATASCSGPGEHVRDCVGRRGQARLAGIGEERGRRFRTDENHVPRAREHLERVVHHVGNAIHRHAPAAARHARDLGGCAQLRAADVRNAVGRNQARFGQGLAGQDQHRRLAAAQRPRDRAQYVGRDGRTGGHRQAARRLHRLRSTPCRPAGSAWRSARAESWPPAPPLRRPRPRARTEVLVRTQCETARASPSVSVVSGGSYGR